MGQNESLKYYIDTSDTIETDDVTTQILIGVITDYLTTPTYEYKGNLDRHRMSLTDRSLDLD